MKEKKFIKLYTPHMTAVFLLLLCLFLGMAPETKAQAAEWNNPAYTFTSTKDASVSTTANPGQTTILVFGYTGCGKTRSTLNSISSCDWVHRSDIRVIFADTQGHSKDEVASYEEGYQCKEMIFCYDEWEDTIFSAMIGYTSLLGSGTGGNYPVIVWIDKNNKVRNMTMGAKTADEILTEIKKFEDIDAEVGTTPSGSGEGYENFAYGLKTIEGATISTKANPNETTVLLFGNTGCPITAATLREIDGSSWVSRSDIRVIYADMYGATQSETAEFAKNYTSGKILFCHDEAGLNLNHGLIYIGLDHHTGGQFPFIILIDKNNKVRKITLGYQSADEIIQEIEKFSKEDQTAGGNQNDPVVSDVTGFSAVAAAKNVKLSWNPVSGAAGYEIYQYDNAKNAWGMKAALDAAAVSYTVKGLTPGEEYRFAIRAFVNPEGKNPVYSKTYVSLDTATAPKEVNFKVRAGKKKATIRWNKVKGATGYTVYYKTKAKGSWKKLKSLKKTSYTKTKLKSGKTYYFTVKAYKKYNGQTYTSSFNTKKVKIK